MRILQINAVGQTLSTGRCCKEVQDYINERTEHTCFTAFAQGRKDAHSFPVGNPIEWKLHGLFSRISGKQAHFSYCGTKALIRRIDTEIKPDVVVLRNVHGNYLQLPVLLKYLAKKDIATVLMLDDCWYFTGKCTHYTVDGCYKWQTGCGDCPRLKNDNVSWFIDATASLWREKKALFEAIPRLGVIGVSDWITNEARKSYLSCARELKRIYNWIDLNAFKPLESSDPLRKKYALDGEKLILGVASGWSNAKGLDKFIEAAHKLPDGYVIALVGKLPGDVTLPENMRSIPPTSSVQELAEFYSMADVFVTMSQEESFGKVSAEALACGTPVVCFDSTANKELVGNSCGEVVERIDIDEMCRAIVRVCQKGRAYYTEACRASAEQRFEKERLIEDYIEFLERING